MKWLTLSWTCKTYQLEETITNMCTTLRMCTLKIYLDRAKVPVLKWKFLRNYVSKVDYWEWKLSSRQKNSQIRTSVHQAVAPPQLEVAPPAVTCCKRLHRSSQRCNRPQLCPFLTQARAGGETDPNSLPSPLYSSKPPPSPFLPS